MNEPGYTARLPNSDAASFSVKQRVFVKPHFVLCFAEMRQDWARTWARLLAPGGELLTMVYPVDASLGEGPPWPVTPEFYKQLLPPAGRLLNHTYEL
jgi:hypothetical protein